MSTTLEVTREQVAALAARPVGEPVLMVNLLKFKADGGLESYLRYAQEVAPHLQRVGATVRYSGSAPAYVIGEGERPWWDAILVVEYPTPQSFVEMVSTPEYSEVHQHRAAGLERGDLVATSTWALATDIQRADSTDDGQAALAAQSVQSALHHGAHVGIDLVDVGVRAEPRGDIDRPQHLTDDLGR